MKEIRLLKANEIECRVGQCGQTNNGGWCSLLLYKDARCDMKLMDETFGVFGWQKSYELINGNLFCTVSVRDKDGNWITRQDVGTESNTEKEKGQASDAFKRACVNFGIGRELYTAPKIFISLSAGEMVDRNGKKAVSPKVVFTVSEISYDENRNINALVIVDNNGVIRYKMGQPVKNVQPQSDADEPTIEEIFNGYALPAIKQARSQTELTRIWNDYPQLQTDGRFSEALNARLTEIKNAA